MSIARALITLSLLIALSGCGFQLRDTGLLQTGFDRLFIDDRLAVQQLIDQPLSRVMAKQLQKLGTEIVSNASEGTAGIIIYNEQNRQRSIGLSAGLYSSHIEIDKTIDYQIVNAKGEILISSSISASKELVEDRSNHAAKNAEQQILIDAINRDLSRQLIRQLSAVLAR